MRPERNGKSRLRGSEGIITPPPHFLLATRSRVMAEVLERAMRYAVLDHLCIVLFGDTGVGKSLFADLIHRSSRRAAGPFGEMNLARMSESTAESDLFGHARGAFTDAKGERAGLCLSSHHGSLFLDEFGKASHGIQRQLLALLDKRAIRRLGDDRATPVDVRFIVGTNVHPKELMKAGKLLPDLYYRLGYNYVVIPPLRERREDIPALAAHFIRELGERSGYAPDALPTLDREVASRLVRHDWPGNVRELASVIETMLANAQGGPILTIDHWPDQLLEVDVQPAALEKDTEDGREALIRKVQDMRRAGASIEDLMLVSKMGRSTIYKWIEGIKPGQAPDGDPPASIA